MKIDLDVVRAQNERNRTNAIAAIANVIRYQLGTCPACGGRVFTWSQALAHASEPENWKIMPSSW